MKKPPTLCLVGPDTEATLGKHGRALWNAIVLENVFDDAAGRELLCAACQALDRAEACREQVDADGEVIRQGGTLREHPALRAELSNRSFVARSLTRLSLGLEPVRPIGRPPMKGYQG